MHGAPSIVVCLDGTGRQFDDHNSNVVRLFSMLPKQHSEKAYYQPGIGTYSRVDCQPIHEPSFMERMNYRNNRQLDFAFATNLKEHILGAYRFLVDHYEAGDNICIFGYSRGAYTARALAGMIAKVGLTTQCNDELIKEAYEIYQRDDEEGWVESENFKNCYSVDPTITIKFVGVWDTVSSVGLIPHHLPLTCNNPCIETFRHALSLDERRVNFQPLLYHHGSDYNEFSTNVSEVWFSGGHADVGGGAMGNGETYGLSCIPLRWMIRECFLAETGIRFSHRKLREIGLEPNLLEPNVLPRLQDVPLTVEELRAAVGREQPGFYEDNNPTLNAMLAENFRDLVDVLSPIHDALRIHKAWWLLEVTRGWRWGNGHFGPHNGHGRIVEDQHNGMHVHRSVKLRIGAGRLWSQIERANNASLGLERYKPAVQFAVEPKWVD